MWAPRRGTSGRPENGDYSRDLARGVEGSRDEAESRVGNRGNRLGCREAEAVWGAVELRRSVGRETEEGLRIPWRPGGGGGGTRSRGRLSGAARGFG